MDLLPGNRSLGASYLSLRRRMEGILACPSRVAAWGRWHDAEPLCRHIERAVELARQVLHASVAELRSTQKWHPLIWETRTVTSKRMIESRGLANGRRYHGYGENGFSALLMCQRLLLCGKMVLSRCAENAYGQFGKPRHRIVRRRRCCVGGFKHP